MSLAPLDPVFPDSTELDAWRHMLPGDFLPASPETAQWFRGEDNWWTARFSPTAAPLPARLSGITSQGDLPPGVMLLRPLSCQVSFQAPVPFGLDVHWLKEISEGVLRGTTGLRVQSAGTAKLSFGWAAEWIAAAVREETPEGPGLRVVVARRTAKAGGASAEGAWSVRADGGILASPREVAAALLGVHPLNWVRGLLNDLGSKRVEQFVKEAGSTLRAFDALREFWQGLGSRAEAGFWELVQGGLPWDELAQWLRQQADIALQDLLAEVASQAPGWLPPQLVQAVTGFVEDMAAGSAAGGIETGVTAAQALANLLEKEGVVPLLAALPGAVQRELNWSTLGPWAVERLGELFGSNPPKAFQDLLARWSDAAQKLANPAAAAVSRQWELRLAAGISARREEAAVADATFRFSEEGVAAAAQVAQGDLSPLFQPGSAVLRLRRALLTDAFKKRTFLELHAPMLRARRKQQDLESFVSAEACATEDGRLQIRYTARASDVITTDLRVQTAMVFSAALSACDGEARRDHFSLTYTDCRKLDPSAASPAYRRVLAAYGLQDVALPSSPCTALLHLSLPGPCVEAWMDTPPPGSPGYLPAMGRVAHAVQQMARYWLPALYLTGLEAYSRPSAVHPLLAWSCSPPCSGPKKKDLSYDFMDPRVVEAVLQAGAAEFRQRLEETWKLLVDAGRRQTAAYYEPSDTRYILANVKRQQRNFVSLLMADAFLVEAVLNVADCAREVNRLVRTAPKAAVGEMARFARMMAETFHRKLQRLYAGNEFLALGPLFFLTATSALSGTGAPQPEVAAVLTLEWEGGKASYSNDAARRLL